MIYLQIVIGIALVMLMVVIMLLLFAVAGYVFFTAEIKREKHLIEMKCKGWSSSLGSAKGDRG